MEGSNGTKSGKSGNPPSVPPDSQSPEELLTSVGDDGNTVNVGNARASPEAPSQRASGSPRRSNTNVASASTIVVQTEGNASVNPLSHAPRNALEGLPESNEFPSHQEGSHHSSDESGRQLSHSSSEVHTPASSSLTGSTTAQIATGGKSEENISNCSPSTSPPNTHQTERAQVKEPRDNPIDSQLDDSSGCPSRPGREYQDTQRNSPPSVSSPPPYFADEHYDYGSGISLGLEGHLGNSPDRFSPNYEENIRPEMQQINYSMQQQQQMQDSQHHEVMSVLRQQQVQQQQMLQFMRQQQQRQQSEVAQLLRQQSEVAQLLRQQQRHHEEVVRIMREQLPQQQEILQLQRIQQLKHDDHSLALTKITGTQLEQHQEIGHRLTGLQQELRCHRQIQPSCQSNQDPGQYRLPLPSIRSSTVSTDDGGQADRSLNRETSTGDVFEGDEIRSHADQRTPSSEAAQRGGNRTNPLRRPTDTDMHDDDGPRSSIDYGSGITLSSMGGHSMGASPTGVPTEMVHSRSANRVNNSNASNGRDIAQEPSAHEIDHRAEVDFEELDQHLHGSNENPDISIVEATHPEHPLAAPAMTEEIQSSAEPSAQARVSLNSAATPPRAGSSQDGSLADQPVLINGVGATGRLAALSASSEALALALPILALQLEPNQIHALEQILARSSTTPAPALAPATAPAPDLVPAPAVAPVPAPALAPAPEPVPAPATYPTHPSALAPVTASGQPLTDGAVTIIHLANQQGVGQQLPQQLTVEQRQQVIQRRRDKLKREEDELNRQEEELNCSIDDQHLSIEATR